MIPTKIVIHHSASRPDTTMEQINEWHKARFNFPSSFGSFVGYHYVIEESGKVYQCRRDNEFGMHSVPNDGKIGVCVVGNFQKDFPTNEQIVSLEKVVNELKKVYNINEVLGHRDYNPTECPGDNLYKIILQWRVNLLQKLIQEILKRLKIHA